MGLRDELPLSAEISLLRIVAQRLVPTFAADTPAEVVRENLAVQGQQLDALPQALALRVTGGSFSQVAGAFNRGEIVRCRPMRGTVHAVAAENYHWLRQSLRRPGMPNVHDERLQITAEILRDAAQIAWDKLSLPSSQTPSAAKNRLSRPASVSAEKRKVNTETVVDFGNLKRISRGKMFDAWLEEGLAAHLEAGRHREFCTRLMYRLDNLGLLIEGPLSAARGNPATIFGPGHDFFDARTLPAAHGEGSYLRLAELPWEFADAPSQEAHKAWRKTDEYRLALATVAYHYALSHGPVSAGDLVRWAGLGVGEAKQALTDAAAGRLPDGVGQSAGLGEKLPSDAATLGTLEGQSAANQAGLPNDETDHEMRLQRPQLVARYLDEDGHLQPLARPLSALLPREHSDRVFYLREDLPERLAQVRGQALQLMHLPAFDEIHVGYKNRTCLTDYEGELLICPTQNGMFRPLLVEKGRVVAVTVARQDEALFHPRTRRSKRLEAAIGRALRHSEKLRQS